MMDNLKKYKKAWEELKKWVKKIKLEEGERFDEDLDVSISWRSCCEEGVVYFELSFSMMYGLFLEFFDEQGIIITLEYQRGDELFYWCINSTTKENMRRTEFEDKEYKNRQEAQSMGVQKAFEILEERLK